jgi:hypothetical protein
VDVVVQVHQKLVILINFSYIIDMKPLNLDNSPCSPISSNCVIWQGPDIPCIKLCTGDTVSDVIFKLATELCTILDQLNVTNYDLSCFNSTACPPADFQALIQFLINQICESQGITNTTKSTTASGCPDCVVEVASCFVEDRVTTMQLVDYVLMIGRRICSLILEIQVINDSINNLISITDSLQTQISSIPVYQLPTITLSCSIGTYPIGSQVALDNLLDEYINVVWCPYVAATGTGSDLLAAVAQKCVSDTTLQLSNGNPFSTNPNWIADVNYSTVADAINNLWVVLCDMRDYVDSNAISVQDTASIDLTFTSNVISAKITDTGWVDLNGFAYYSGVAKPQCRRIGNQVHFRGNVYIPLENPASPGAVVPLTSTQAYNSIQGCTTWSGAGGCTVVASGGIIFNNGASVVPASITTGNFDALYRSGWQPIARQLTVNGTYGTALTSVVNIFITANKQLEIQTLIDVEDGNAVTPLLGNSPFRFITSNTKTGQYLPNYIGATSNIQNAPTNANFPLDSDTFVATWDFNCDAAQPGQIGGFEFSLDGMIAYLDPCNIETGLSTTCP